MGLFKKLFGADEKPTPSDTPTPPVNPAPAASEQELMERYAAMAHEKQLYFGEVIGNHNWDVDIRQGTIRFGDRLVFPIQVLGTFSHSSQTWLWAWANTQSGLPESLLQQALRLKQYGEENGIDLLHTAESDAETDDLHRIGSIASGLFNAGSYYIADYGKGAMVVTIQNNEVDLTRSNDHLRTLTVFPAVISQFEMNHQPALRHYLAAKGYTVTEDGPTLHGTKGTDTIKATFDEQGRLTALNG